MACTVPSGLLGRDLTRVPTDRKVVALTFDAGASNDGVASILATLADKGVPRTFFLTGDFVDAFPSSARAMAKYPIGNHTYNHPDLTTLSDSGIRTEINSAESRIKAVTGQDPRPYFRFPFGAVTTRTIAVVNAECYVPFRWTVDTLGWKGTSGGQSVGTVVNRVLDAAVPGEIVLMHVGAHPKDGSTLDADALPRMIDALRARGYGFVTLQAVLGSAP
ncbi:polysaccharide deacetylase family protein [Intrasporangium calvum]|uniref:polysaccharide deacetylase family protein n=1 Tax=Intrasporangium calvum TaxID=53358 RepID=UPI0002FF1F8E|nr:polysaccharide deacetylase family protein [Intrasporangium calvum]